MKVKKEQKEDDPCDCTNKVKEAMVDGNLGFSSQLIGDTDFARSLDEIFYKGTHYKKLGIRIHEGPRNQEKVKKGIGLGLIENYKKRYQDAEKTEFKAK